MIFAIAFALLGVEVAAVACERPFRDQENHLPLSQFASVVEGNLLQILAQGSPRDGGGEDGATAAP